MVDLIKCLIKIITAYESGEYNIVERAHDDRHEMILAWKDLMQSIANDAGNIPIQKLETWEGFRTLEEI